MELCDYTLKDFIDRVDRKNEKALIKSIFIQILEGIIFMHSKKIRDDTGTQHGAGRWLQLEEYLSRKSGADLSHGCCPECYEKFVKKWQKTLMIFWRYRGNNFERENASCTCRK